MVHIISVRSAKKKQRVVEHMIENHHILLIPEAGSLI